MRLSWHAASRFLHANSNPQSAEFNEHQLHVFCVFSGPGVTRLRQYLNADNIVPNYEADGEPDGTMYDDGDELDSNGGTVINVHQQVTGMMGATALEEVEDDFGEGSELLG